MKTSKTNEAQLPMGGPVLHKATSEITDPGKAVPIKEKGLGKELYLPRVTPILRSFNSTVRTYRSKAELIEEMASLSEKEIEVLADGFKLTAKFFEEQGAKVLAKLKK